MWLQPPLEQSSKGKHAGDLLVQEERQPAEQPHRDVCSLRLRLQRRFGAWSRARAEEVWHLPLRVRGGDSERDHPQEVRGRGELIR